MDMFCFMNPNNQMKMEEGVFVKGARSKMWVERFRDPGEFEISGPLDAGLREQLPLGYFVSHTNTKELMVVENHVLEDNGVDTPMVKVTGRTFETILDQRVVGQDRIFPTSGTLAEYSAPADYTWLQIVYLIRNHINLADLEVHTTNAIPYTEALTTVTGTSGTNEARVIERGPLHQRVMELLRIDNLGIKSIRPVTGSPVAVDGNTAIVIYRGVDRSNTVTFSHALGEVTRADYLWSNKTLKTHAMVSGRWIEVFVANTADTGINRRVLYVDAADIDQAQTEAPTGLARSWIISAMQARGREELAKQKPIALGKAEINEMSQRFRYRKDYDLGDIVMVVGDYEASAKRRVTEYVEIEDENGMRGYPTVADPDEGATI
jgi:hypothetical protein